ncbi:MAG: yciH [Proteobacteria bacterium]|nr:yciH [Pseudomonadota bacterium]
MFRAVFARKTPETPGPAADVAPYSNGMGRTPAPGIVYTTGLGAICPGCRRPVADCVCRKADGRPARDQVIRVSREVAGRKGKGVSVVTGLPLGPAELETLAGDLKRRCGSGGTVRDGRIEIQGDHRDLLVEELGKRGYKVKRAGG